MLSKNKIFASIREEDIRYTWYEKGEKVVKMVKVMILEDQPDRLTLATAADLFEKHGDVKEIHELHTEWGGRWERNSTLLDRCCEILSEIGHHAH